MMDLIYEHPSGGRIFQCGAGEIPGTPESWHYNWYKPGFYDESLRQKIHDNIVAALKSSSIDLLVLAGEYQPSFSDVDVLSTPIDDDFKMSDIEAAIMLQKVLPVASRMAETLESGKGILSTCWAGKNRSGLLTALTLKKLTKDDKPLLRSQDIISLLREKRHNMCLSNPVFYDIVTSNIWEH